MCFGSNGFVFHEVRSIRLRVDHYVISGCDPLLLGVVGFVVGVGDGGVVGGGVESVAPRVGGAVVAVAVAG